MKIPLYDLIFYKYYKFISSNIPENSTPVLSTNLLLTMLAYTNILAFTGYDFNVFFPNSGNLGIFILGTSIIIIHYFLFYIKKRYLKIVERYDKTSDSQQKLGSVLGILYLAFTIIYAVFHHLF